MYGSFRSAAMRWIASAILRACCSDSMTHGPAIRNSFPPPTSTAPILNESLTSTIETQASAGFHTDRGALCDGYSGSIADRELKALLRCCWWVWRFVAGSANHEIGCACCTDIAKVTLIGGRPVHQ